MEPREVIELRAAIEILKDVKEAADKGLLWRDPNNFSEQYRRSYEAVISKYFGIAIPALEGLAQEDKRRQLSEAMSDIPDTKKEYLLGYAEAVADMKKKEE